MPKKPLKLKIVAYDKQNEVFGIRVLSGNNYEEIFREYKGYVDFLLCGEFVNVARIDLVSFTRVLFSCCSLRHVIDQKNYTINFNPF